MTREEKATVIEDLTAKLADSTTIYLADISGLDAATTSALRRACFKANIKLSVVKIPCWTRPWRLRTRNLENFLKY